MSATDEQGFRRAAELPVGTVQDSVRLLTRLGGLAVAVERFALLPVPACQALAGASAIPATLRMFHSRATAGQGERDSPSFQPACCAAISLPFSADICENVGVTFAREGLV